MNTIESINNETLLIVPPIEKYIGIYNYLIKTSPSFGKIKIQPKDFFVEEIIKDIQKQEKGKFIVIKLKKINWDTIKLTRKIAKILEIEPKKVKYLGIKDKKAETIQYIFIESNELNIEKIKELPDIEILDVFYTNRFPTGDLLIGNRFKIKIYEIKNMENFKLACEEVKNKGFLNYFGIQRFGTTRPNTHLIGRLLLQEAYEEAFFELVCRDYGTELEKTRKYREMAKEGRLEEFLKEAPPWLYYEKLLVSNYLRFKNYKKAFRRLPKNYRSLFFHSYQSYLFNRALSMYSLEGNIPKSIVVSESNEKIKEILYDDGIETLKISKKLGVKLKPFERLSIEFPKFFKYKILSNNCAILEFELNKGCYATSLIREICKGQYW